MFVVERLVVGDAGAAGVDLRATELLGGDVLAGRGLHQRRAAKEDRAGAADDDGLVAHRGHVRATGRARAHDQRDLRDRGGRHPRLVVEDPAEVVAVREDVGLERQERAARIDQVDAWQPVLERDLLRPQVLADRHRVVRTALDRRVVGDDHAGRAFDPADPGDDPGSGRVVVVQAGRREGRQLEEGRAWVEQALDALADRELASLAVALDRVVVTARTAIRDRRLACTQVLDKGGHRLMVGAHIVGRGVESAAQDGHAAMIGRDRRELDGAHRRPRDMRALLTGILVVVLAGCGGAAVTASGPLMTVETRGGECFAGPCGMTVVLERDGSVHSAAKPPNALGAVTPEQLQTLSTLIATTDFAVIRARPFTGECPTAFDGQELVFVFAAPSGPQRIATCEVEVDFGLPVFVAVSSALGPFIPLPTT